MNKVLTQGVLLLICFYSHSLFSETLLKDVSVRDEKGRKIFSLKKGVIVSTLVLDNDKSKIQVSLRVLVGPKGLKGRYKNVIPAAEPLKNEIGKEVGKTFRKVGARLIQEVRNRGKVFAIKGIIPRDSINKFSEPESVLLEVIKRSKKIYINELESYIKRFKLEHVSVDYGYGAKMDSYMLLDDFQYSISHKPRLVLLVYKKRLFAIIYKRDIDYDFFKKKKVDHRYNIGFLKKVSKKIKKPLTLYLGLMKNTP